MHIRKILFTAALLAATTPALAGGFYVLGTVGASRFDGGDTAEAESILRAIGWSNISSSFDDSSNGYKLQLGYQIDPNFAIEGGLVDLGKYHYNLTATNLRANADIKASGINIAALGLLPVNESVSAFAKLGAIRANLEVHTQATNTSNGASATTNKSATSWSPVIGLGANIALAPNMMLRLELEEFKKLGDADKTGEANVRLFSAGLAFKF